MMPPIPNTSQLTANILLFLLILAGVSTANMMNGVEADPTQPRCCMGHIEYGLFTKITGFTIGADWHDGLWFGYTGIGFFIDIISFVVVCIFFVISIFLSSFIKNKVENHYA